MLRTGYCRFVSMTLIMKILNYVNLVLGGVLRGIEFIYKEPGVNKPLYIRG